MLSCGPMMHNDDLKKKSFFATLFRYCTIYIHIKLDVVVPFVRTLQTNALLSDPSWSAPQCETYAIESIPIR